MLLEAISYIHEFSQKTGRLSLPTKRASSVMLDAPGKIKSASKASIEDFLDHAAHDPGEEPIHR